MENLFPNYLAVKIEGILYCGARFVLDEAADYRPWPDGGRYVNCMTVKDMEFCGPFNRVCLSTL